MTVLTVGESMALLDPLEDGALRLGMPLTLRFAGAESNLAIALARLGLDVAWISKLGRDPFAPDYHPQEVFEMAQRLYKSAKR